MKRVKIPKDEATEQAARKKAKEYTDIADQQLRWAHQRTEESMEKDDHESADCHSHTCFMWMSKLTGGA